MELDEYQARANRTDQRPGTDEQALAYPMLGLASEVGSLVNQFKKRVRDGEAHELFESKAAAELGDILWYVSNVANKLGFRLSQIAEQNLQRINERWPAEEAALPALLLDDNFPTDEQLPRLVDVIFREEQTANGHRRVIITSNGLTLGDPLTDMSWADDHYRYHDAFHLTYAAVLGWSPVTRAFFGKQRNSNSQYREIEDSGRAKAIEEAIAALLFDYASEEQFLEGVSRIDSAMLNTVRQMTNRFEVRIRTSRDWEQAILRSFEIWRQLKQHRSGLIKLDLRARTISFTPVGM